MADESKEDYIPGESERDRRLRLRALEKKSRLSSAKSNASIYSNPPQSVPNYQENIKFPENSILESNKVKPAMQMNEIPSNRFDQGFDRGNFRREETVQPPIYSRQQ